MRKDDMLVALINEAKEDVNAADELIRTYMPFIKNETSKFIMRLLTLKYVTKKLFISLKITLFADAKLAKISINIL